VNGFRREGWTEAGVAALPEAAMLVQEVLTSG
jgi:hypothetical protein